MQFKELNLSPEAIKAVEAMGFEEATSIQAESIPLLLEGKDVIGRSNTGTGKTAAFGIPAVESIKKGSDNGVQVLIMCPTRELAMQACDEIKRFAQFMPWVKPCAVFGGASIEKQIMGLKRGANLVVGTPGRIMDHIDRRTLKLGNLKTIILDEADEMLNMGFREDIEEILKSVPDERQTVLFSATMPPAIMAITKTFQKDPVIVKVESKQRTVAAIEQYFYEVPMGRKVDALVLLLSMYEPKLSIIFCNTKKMVEELCEALALKGFKASGLHGDMKQMQRTQVMERFKNGHTPILIATDVAARGIDVDDVDAVFNYDIPQDYEYYIHRIGRTGRAGRSGTAFTLTSGRKQAYQMKDIQRFIKAEISLMTLPSSSDIKAKKLEKFSEKLIKVIEEGKNTEYAPMLEKLNESGISTEMVATALLHMQLSKVMKSIPAFEQVVNSKGRMQDKATRNVAGKASCKIILSSGRRNRIAPNFIIGALADATGLSGKSFGKIDIYDNYTTVEVPESEKDNIISAMDGGKINGQTVTCKLMEGESHHSNNGGGNRRGSSYRGGNGNSRSGGGYRGKSGGFSRGKSSHSGSSQGFKKRSNTKRDY